MGCLRMDRGGDGVIMSMPTLKNFPTSVMRGEGSTENCPTSVMPGKGSITTFVLWRKGFALSVFAAEIGAA